MEDTPEIYLAKSGKCKHSNSRYPDTAIAAWPYSVEYIPHFPIKWLRNTGFD